MRVFCPTCGYANDATQAGVGVTCRSCGSTFQAEATPTKVAAPPPAVTAPTQVPSPSSFTPAGAGVPYNPLAVISLVLGIVCCIPFAGFGAIITGAMARKQIEASRGAQRGAEFALAGMVLGAAAVGIMLIGMLMRLSAAAR